MRTSRKAFQKEKDEQVSGTTERMNRGRKMTETQSG
jgi:hypothetical protein